MNHSIQYNPISGIVSLRIQNGPWPARYAALCAEYGSGVLDIHVKYMVEDWNTWVNDGYPNDMAIWARCLGITGTTAKQLIKIMSNLDCSNLN